MERAMEEAAQVQVATLLRRVEWLNLMGNIGPMLGLLGTVWGMILAFFTIVAMGGMPHPGDLAGAIGTALVTTLTGLMIAIPALSVYATMRHRIDALTAEAMVLCQEWIAASQATRPAVIPMPPEPKKARAVLNPTAS
jgi:biopolymer transport protein ExbB